jgi:hypothetical protein
MNEDTVKDMLLLLCAVFVYLLCALPVIIVNIRTFTQMKMKQCSVADTKTVGSLEF